MTARTIRARVREELTSEIKAIARRQLGIDGANLSLRAVARELGMVSSAVYRYFPSRDDLLTALIIDCYNELGEAAEAAEARVDRTDLLGRWLAVGQAVRRWALANPAEYALIYGSPVPGYRAPVDTIGPASRPTMLILRLLADGFAAGVLAAAGPGAPLPAVVEADLRRLLVEAGLELPIELLARGTTAWIQLFGAVSFELFGRLNNLIEASRPDFFDYQLRTVAAHVGLA